MGVYGFEVLDIQPKMGKNGL